MTEIDLSEFVPDKPNSTVSETPKLVSHKWAEVIKAWADGKTVQYRMTHGSPNVWWDYKHNQNDRSLDMFDEDYFEWRIKPEKKTGWINIYQGRDDRTFYALRDSKEEANETATVKRIACIQITYTEGEGL